MRDDEHEVDEYDPRHYAPLVWWWTFDRGPVGHVMQPNNWQLLAQNYPDRVSDPKDPDGLDARVYQTLVTLESDLREAVLGALVKRALDGDVQAVLWLDERGLLGDLPPRIASDEHGEGDS